MSFQKKRATQTRSMGKKVEPDNKGGRGETKKQPRTALQSVRKALLDMLKMHFGVVRNIQFQAVIDYQAGNRGKNHHPYS